MKYLLAGGGTAGHINPALAIAGEIQKREPDAEITFVGTPWGMEARLVPQAGFRFIPMNVSGFQRKISAENIKRNWQAVWYLANSSREARKIISRVVRAIKRSATIMMCLRLCLSTMAPTKGESTAMGSR